MRTLLLIILLVSLSACRESNKEEQRSYRNLAKEEAAERVAPPISQITEKFETAKANLDNTNPHVSRSALGWMLSSAKEGYAPAQLCIAKLYHEGKVVDKNEYIAFQWYLACAQQEPEAAFNVGLAYLVGQLGQQQDIEQGIVYLNYAAVKNYQPAVTVIHNLQVEGKKKQEDKQKQRQVNIQNIQIFREEALKGSATAQLNLAKALAQHAIPQYDKAALYWATQAAKQGNVDAKFLLGEFYYGGVGTQVNYERAFAIFNELAREDHPISMYRLGKMYTEGQGVSKDDYVGKRLIMQAADLGVDEAKTMVKIWTNAKVAISDYDEDDRAPSAISANELDSYEEDE